MSSKIESHSVYNADNMETVELHRADSMVESPIEIVKTPEKALTIQIHSYSNICSRITSCFSEIKHLKIEVVMFFYMFSYIMRSVSSTTMVMDKVCLVHLGQTASVCQNLGNYSALKSEVEKLTNNYTLAHSMISMVPSAILGCFIGAWSDKYGRKVPIIIALIGIILDGLGATLCAAIFYSRVEYYLIPAFFTGFSGGFIGVLTVLYSYASDTTTFAKRTTKYALMEAAFGLSMPLGQLAGGWLYKFSGYVTVFLVSTAGHVFGLAWVLFVLKETRGLDNTDSWRVKINSFFSIKPVMNGFNATIKVRPNKGREQILLLILATSINVLAFASTAHITFMYVHHLYNWGNTEFSTISAIFSVIGTVAMLISVTIFRCFKLGDATLGIVGTTSLLIKYIALGLASQKWLFFVSNLLGLLSGLGNLASRSRISKVASKNDLGMVFAFLSTAESLLPIISVAVATQIFNATLDIYPGIIFLVVGSLVAISLGVFVWLATLPVVDYEEMHTNPEDERSQWTHTNAVDTNSVKEQEHKIFEHNVKS